MGIIDTTNLSWSTRKVSVSKEVIILCRYESKHVNNTRLDCIKYQKDPENLKTSCGQENPIFLLIEKFLELNILCHDSPKVG
jgi:hypothetical protein